MITTV
jgi:hypothetical protein